MTGNYAINNTIPWYEQPYEPPKSKKKKKIKVIVHSLFQECEAVVDDPFWKEMFVKMSMNKLPKGFRVNDDKLVCHDRNKSQYVSLVGSIDEVASRCMSLLREKANILSQIDKSEIKDSLLSIHKEVNEPRTWKQVRGKKGEKRAAIIEFASEKVDELGLTITEFNDLLTLINLNLYLGKIDNNDVEYQDGCIVKINGLVIENGKFILDERHSTRRCKYKNKDVPFINLRVRHACELSSSWAKVAAARMGKTKVKILKEMTMSMNRESSMQDKESSTGDRESSTGDST